MIVTHYRSLVGDMNNRAATGVSITLEQIGDGFSGLIDILDLQLALCVFILSINDNQCAIIRGCSRWLHANDAAEGCRGCHALDLF